jgi:hypothetical protein
MADIIISASLTALTILMAYLGVHVTLHPPNESPRAQLLYKVGFFVCGILAVMLVITQGVRSRKSQSTASNEITTLKATLSSVRSDLSNVETATSLLRSEQATEIARRQQAEKDLAIIVQGSGKAVRAGVVSDIKKSPITVQINGQGVTSQPLEVEDLKLFSEPENSTHSDAPYAVKITLQATAPIDPLRIAIRCTNEIKYVEQSYPSGMGNGQMWYGGIEVYKNDHTIVIANMTGTGKAPIRPDLPLILHIASAEPIVIKSFERGPR